MERKLTKLFSFRQISVATFIGGPLAVIYIMHHNYKALDKINEAKAVVFWGSILAACLILIVPFDTSDYISKDIFGKIVALICFCIAGFLSQSHPIQKNEIAESEAYGFQSNWLVAIITLASAAIFILFILLAAIGFEQMGYISLDE